MKIALNPSKIKEASWWLGGQRGINSGAPAVLTELSGQNFSESPGEALGRQDGSPKGHLLVKIDGSYLAWEKTSWQ